MHFPQHSPG